MTAEIGLGIFFVILFAVFTALDVYMYVRIERRTAKKFNDVWQHLVTSTGIIRDLKENIAEGNKLLVILADRDPEPTKYTKEMLNKLRGGIPQA